MTAPARVTSPLLQALAAPARPAWKVRGMIRRDDPDGPTVCLRIPAGLAETPEQALEVARRRHPDAMQALHPDRWRAFPVTDPEPEVL